MNRCYKLFTCSDTCVAADYSQYLHWFKWGAKQAYLAMGNMLTVCATQGVDACPMEGFIPEKYDEILGLKKQNLSSVLVLPIGFRAEDCYMKDLAKVRKDVQDTVIDIN